MSICNAPQSAPERHFDVFADLYPNHCTPQFTPEIDRLVTAVERLSCCTVCSERLMTWLVEGRFGPDYQVALEKIVLALATQDGETTISQQDQVSWMHKTQSPS